MPPPPWDPSSARTALPFLFREFVDGDAGVVHATVELASGEAGVGEGDGATPDLGIGVGDGRAEETGAGGIEESG